MTFADTLLFSLLAAILALDQMACFQVLLARPILTAVILGAVFGNLTEAALVGLCFEFLFVRSIPLKERATADPTLATAAVLGGIWGGAPYSPLSMAPFAAALGLLAAFMSKWFDVRLRGVNVEFSRVIHRPGAVQITAIGALFAKSFGFYLLTVLAVQGALPKIMAALGPIAPAASALAWIALISVCLAYAAAPVIQGVARDFWIAGMVIGIAFIAAAKFLSWSTNVTGGAALVLFVLFTLVEIGRYAWRKREPAP